MKKNDGRVSSLDNLIMSGQPRQHLPAEKASDYRERKKRKFIIFFLLFIAFWGIVFMTTRTLYLSFQSDVNRLSHEKTAIADDAQDDENNKNNKKLHRRKTKNEGVEVILHDKDLNKKKGPVDLGTTLEIVE
jgi:hypothetical protein